MISKVINDIATDSMKIKGIKENIVNQSSSVVSYSGWLNNEAHKNWHSLYL